ncbi:MAG: hypothetical protein JXA42_24815, partial [Anaerolineales bacterium]|nr:hypothetical protein [Anaerolineales bacterium]
MSLCIRYIEILCLLLALSSPSTGFNARNESNQSNIYTPIHISMGSKFTAQAAFQAASDILAASLAGQDSSGRDTKDISGVWSPPRTKRGADTQPAIRAPETATATLTLPSVSVLPGELVTAPMTLTLP